MGWIWRGKEETVETLLTDIRCCVCIFTHVFFRKSFFFFFTNYIFTTKEPISNTFTVTVSLALISAVSNRIKVNITPSTSAAFLCNKGQGALVVGGCLGAVCSTKVQSDLCSEPSVRTDVVTLCQVKPSIRTRPTNL